MSPSPLEQPYLLLIKFLLMSKRRLMDRAAEYGLTGMQAMMLFLLDEPRPMYSFKNILNCDASNVTGLVDGLEEKQLASRYTDPDDRRVKMVKLTPSGQSLRRKLMKSLTGQDGSVLSKLTPAERQIFSALLIKITDGAAVL